jgi:hypothetical protein
MNKIIITNHPEIRLNDSFFQFEIESAKVSIDMRALFNANTYSENAWINVTPILQSDWSSVKKIATWLRYSNVKEYLNIRNNQFSKVTNQLPLKHAPKNQWLKADWLDNGASPLVLTRRGNNGGTWLHKDMFLKFITTLSVEMEIHLHDMVMNVIKTAETMKISRGNTKALFHPLTDAIKDIYIPAQSSDNAIKFAYVHLMDLANLGGIGMTSRAFKETHNITDSKIKQDGKISIRDYMTKSELAQIEAMEKKIHGYIVYADITDYQTLKSKIL